MSAGVKVQHELAGVGENLRDHYAPRTRWAVGKRGVTYNDKAGGIGLIWQALRYGLTRKGMMGIPAAPIRAFVKSSPHLDAPDCLLGWVPMLYEPGYKLSKQAGFLLATPTLCVRKAKAASISKALAQQRLQLSASIFYQPPLTWSLP